MATTTLRTAQRALDQLGSRGKTTRIPDDVRIAVLAYAREARSRGDTWAGVANRLGLSATALQRWHHQRLECGTLLPVVVPSEIVPEASPPSASLTLTTSHGEKLEGLGVEDAIRIVRALR